MLVCTIDASIDTIVTNIDTIVTNIGTVDASMYNIILYNLLCILFL